MLIIKTKKKQPKVPFGNLIESGLVKIGDFLFSKNRLHKAQILANATLLWNKENGSIHKISAQILSKVSNNGWTFWYTDKNNQLISIDDLRNQYIKKYLV